MRRAGSGAPICTASTSPTRSISPSPAATRSSTGDNNNLTLDLASVAYWYQDTASPLPRSFTKQERQPMPAITPSDIHLWRDAWRKAHGNAPTLWGNERQP